ncbi:hypothetical protein FPQ18DRAFT_387076 [Pyronema domesticum]|nr:hypothetical protein FPQ18DRAFT_387076 [Pyronema domesticum]
MPENQSVPRRCTPPSPGADDLCEFFGYSPMEFGSREWHGVRIERLAPKITPNEIKTMFLFSRGFEDVRIIPSKNSVEVYVRLQSKEHAEEAERLLNNGEMNGTNIAVTVVPCPTLNEIMRMAPAQETFKSNFNSRSPSSDGLITPGTIGALPLGEYTTTGPRSMGIASPPLLPISENRGTIGRNDSLGKSFLSMGMGSLNGNRPATSGIDFYGSDLTSSIDRMSLNDKANLASGLSSPTGFDSGYLSDSYLGDMNSSRPLGSLHQALDEHDGPDYPRPRRQTNPAPQSVSNNRFNLPPLSTMGVNAYSNNGITSPPVTTPGLTSPLSPGGWPPNTRAFTAPFTISHPPANPADQNPPCNTLYVGNLPAQTSEDELKTMFVRQRGYKRMCFRTKPQGPMCFVEFEDTHYATKALTELYGRALSNSTKGGVRLSFSKNPLGVRSQPSSNQRPQNNIPGPGLAQHNTLRTPPGLSNPAYGHPSQPQTQQQQQQQQHQPQHQPQHQQVPFNSTSPPPTAGGPPPGLQGLQALHGLPLSQSMGNGQQYPRIPPGIPSAGAQAFYSGGVIQRDDRLEGLYQQGPGAIGTR